MGWLGRGRRAGDEDAGVPWQAPLRFNFTRDVVEAQPRSREAMTYLDAEGVIERRTFQMLAAGASRWCRRLRDQDVRPGDRVIVALGSTPDWHEAMLGTLKAGAVAVTCPLSVGPGELARRAAETSAQAAVVPAGHPAAAALAASVTVVAAEPEGHGVQPSRGLEPTHDTLSDDDALVLYTAGATGRARPVVHGHAATWAARVQAEHWLDATPDDVVWCTAETGTPMAVWNLLLGPWSCGAEVVVHEEALDPADRIEIVRRLGVTVLCQTPAEYRAMLDADPDGGPARAWRLRRAVSFGETLEPGLAEAFRGRFGAEIANGYATAETGVVAAHLAGVDLPAASLGVALPGHVVSVVDTLGGELPAGIEGDIAVAGDPPSLFRGYLLGEGRQRRGPWYVTGDRGRRDTDGALTLTGRSDRRHAEAVPARAPASFARAAPPDAAAPRADDEREGLVTRLRAYGVGSGEPREPPGS